MKLLIERSLGQIELVALRLNLIDSIKKASGSIFIIELYFSRCEFYSPRTVCDKISDTCCEWLYEMCRV